MKRWLSALLALILCLSITAMADTTKTRIAFPTVKRQQTQQTFSESLATWVEKLDPTAADLVGTVSANGETYSATVRANQEIAELAIPGLATLQLSGTVLTMQLQGQTMVLDLAPILQSMQNAQGVGEIAEEDARILGSLLYQGFVEVLLPFATMTNTYDGLSIHFDMSGEDLEDRLYAYIDKLLENQDVERMYTRYHQMLKASTPDLPETFDEIRALWAENADFRDHPTNLTFLRVEADVHLKTSGYIQFASVGCISTRTAEMNFSIDFSENDDGFSLQGAADQLDLRRHRASSFTVSLAQSGPALDGSLMIGGADPQSYQLSARLDDSIYVELSRYDGNEALWLTSLSVWQEDMYDGISGVLDFTDYSDAEPITRDIASFNWRTQSDGFSAAVSYPGGTLTVREVTADTYVHFVAGVQPGQENQRGGKLDLWLFREGYNAYRLRVDAMQTYRGLPYARKQFTGALSSSSASFRLSDPLAGTSTEGAVRFVHIGSHIDYSIRWLQNSRYAGNMYRRKTPFSLRLTGDGEKYTLSYTNMEGFDSIEASAEFGLNNNGSIAWLEADAARTPAAMQASGEPRWTWHLSYVPGKATLSDGETTATLEKTEETGRRLAYRLTSTAVDTAYEIFIELDEALTTLTVRAEAEGQELVSASIAAKPVTPIEPLDTANAVYVTEEMLQSALTLMYGGRSSSAPATATESAPEASEEPAP